MAVATKPRPAELLRIVGSEGVRAYETAYKSGKNFSAWLEHEDPSDQYKEDPELRETDAFERLLREANIVTVPDPTGLQRWQVGTVEQFGKTPEGRALFPEWIARIGRMVRHGYVPTGVDREGVRAPYTSGDYALNTLANPYVDNAVARTRTLQAAIPLSEVVAFTTEINGDAYRTFFLQSEAAADKRMVRVEEGAEIPAAKIAGSENTVRLYKYARRIEVTYEQVRRRRIDVLAIHLAKMMIQMEVDKVATAIDILVNGDGNSGTAATNYNQSALASGTTAGTLDLEAYLAFKLKFANPYIMTTALVQEAVALQMMMLNSGSGNLPLGVLPGAFGLGFDPINQGLSGTVRLGWTSDAPSLKILGFDKRFALERVTEIGSDISETGKWIERQTNFLTLSEVEGYAISDPNAAKTMNINA